MGAQYWTFDAMWQALTTWQTRYPDLISVEVIGQSRQGRDMPCAVLSNRQTGAPADKAAVLVDANIHAGEVAGNSAAMYWIDWCLSQYGSNPEATELLDRHTVYVIPRLAVDGAELYLTTPCRVRSSPHLYPYSVPPDGFVEEDVDQNGHILSMRMAAEDGAFAVDELNPHVMRPRRPGENGRTYYHVFVEGRIERAAASGSLPAFARADRARRNDMDFNRNFPIRWAGEEGQRGAGPYPLSEPELRNLANFVHEHANIAAYAALHTSGGVILRQPSTGEDTVLSVRDRELFTRVAEMGAEASGYAADSNYHIFASGHEEVLMPGAADDWAYDHFGILGFTVEIWNLPRHAGAQGYADLGMRRVMQRSPRYVLEDQRKIYSWVAREVPTDGIFEWTPFDHPDFGRVEIGGLNPKFVIQNPPEHYLEEECAHVSAFLTRLGLSTPRLVLTHASARHEGASIFRIVVEVANAGYLPTSSTQKGAKVLLEGLCAEVSGDLNMLSGSSPTAVGHLEGYGGQGVQGPPHRQRTTIEWVVKAKPGTTVQVSVGGGRAGRLRHSLTLEVD